MTRQDVPAVERLSDEVFYDLSLRMHRQGWPTPERRSPERSTTWSRRQEHLVGTDPGGCWVADGGGAIVGAATAMRRDTTWLLANYVVDRARQGQGIGRQLLEAAASHGRNCTTAMLLASDDPAALRRYRLAGFDLHPAMLMGGQVGRDVLPVVERVRDGSAADIDLMNSVDRQVRGSAHGPDHELMCTLYPLVVTDRPSGSGYAYRKHEGGPYLLAATSRRIAADLLWETLAASRPDELVTIDSITAANAWALDVGMAARLELHTHNYLAVRGMRPPAPYLPSGIFL